MACHRLSKKLIILGRGETKMGTGGGEKGNPDLFSIFHYQPF